MDIAPHQREYLSAIVAGDRRRALEAVDRARKAGLDVASIYVRVLQPALHEVGRLWQHNELTVAEEHLATAITQVAMARIYGDLVAPSAPGQRSLIAACADTERHEVGLRMVCDLMEEAGWDVTYLGAAVPTESLAALVRDRRPDAVMLSASIAPHLPSVLRMVDAVRRATQEGRRPFILVGGRPFRDDPALAIRVGADATAGDALEAVARMRERFP